MKAHDKVTHFIIQQDVPGKYRFEGDAKSSVKELVTTYVESGQSVTKRSEAKLRKPVYRANYEGSDGEDEELYLTEEAAAKAADPWRLSHRDVSLGKKLGNGNFGEVMKGKMKASGRDVAVKTCKDNVPDPQRFLEEADVLKEYDHPNIVSASKLCALYVIVMSFEVHCTCVLYLVMNGLMRLCARAFLLRYLSDLPWLTVKSGLPG